MNRHFVEHHHSAKRIGIIAASAIATLALVGGFLVALPGMGGDGSTRNNPDSHTATIVSQSTPAQRALWQGTPEVDHNNNTLMRYTPANTDFHRYRLPFSNNTEDEISYASYFGSAFAESLIKENLAFRYQGWKKDPNTGKNVKGWGRGEQPVTKDWYLHKDDYFGLGDDKNDNKPIETDPGGNAVLAHNGLFIYRPDFIDRNKGKNGRDLALDVDSKVDDRGKKLPYSFMPYSDQFPPLTTELGIEDKKVSKKKYKLTNYHVNPLDIYGGARVLKQRDANPNFSLKNLTEYEDLQNIHPIGDTPKATIDSALKTFLDERERAGLRLFFTNSKGEIISNDNTETVDYPFTWEDQSKGRETQYSFTYPTEKPQTEGDEDVYVALVANPGFCATVMSSLDSTLDRLKRWDLGNGGAGGDATQVGSFAEGTDAPIYRSDFLDDDIDGKEDLFYEAVKAGNLKNRYTLSFNLNFQVPKGANGGKIKITDTENNTFKEYEYKAPTQGNVSDNYMRFEYRDLAHHCFQAFKSADGKDPNASQMQGAQSYIEKAGNGLYTANWWKLEVEPDASLRTAAQRESMAQTFDYMKTEVTPKEATDFETATANRDNFDRAEKNRKRSLLPTGWMVIPPKSAQDDPKGMALEIGVDYKPGETGKQSIGRRQVEGVYDPNTHENGLKYKRDGVLDRTGYYHSLLLDQSYVPESYGGKGYYAIKRGVGNFPHRFNDYFSNNSQHPEWAGNGYDNMTDAQANYKRLLQYNGRIIASTDWYNQQNKNIQTYPDYASGSSNALPRASIPGLTIANTCYTINRIKGRVAVTQQEIFDASRRLMGRYGYLYPWTEDIDDDRADITKNLSGYFYRRYDTHYAWTDKLPQVSRFGVYPENSTQAQQIYNYQQYCGSGMAGNITWENDAERYQGVYFGDLMGWQPTLWQENRTKENKDIYPASMEDLSVAYMPEGGVTEDNRFYTYQSTTDYVGDYARLAGGELELNPFRLSDESEYPFDRYYANRGQGTYDTPVTAGFYGGFANPNIGLNKASRSANLSWAIPDIVPLTAPVGITTPGLLNVHQENNQETSKYDDNVNRYIINAHMSEDGRLPVNDDKITDAPYAYNWDKVTYLNPVPLRNLMVHERVTNKVTSTLTQTDRTAIKATCTDGAGEETPAKSFKVTHHIGEENQTTGSGTTTVLADPMRRVSSFIHHTAYLDSALDELSMPEKMTVSYAGAKTDITWGEDQTIELADNVTGSKQKFVITFHDGTDDKGNKRDNSAYTIRAVASGDSTKDVAVEFPVDVTFDMAVKKGSDRVPTGSFGKDGNINVPIFWSGSTGIDKEPQAPEPPEDPADWEDPLSAPDEPGPNFFFKRDNFARAQIVPSGRCNVYFNFINDEFDCAHGPYLKDIWPENLALEKELWQKNSPEYQQYKRSESTRADRQKVRQFVAATAAGKQYNYYSDPVDPADADSGYTYQANNGKQPFFGDCDNEYVTDLKLGACSAMSDTPTQAQGAGLPSVYGSTYMDLSRFDVEGIIGFSTVIKDFAPNQGPTADAKYDVTWVDDISSLLNIEGAELLAVKTSDSNLSGGANKQVAVDVTPDDSDDTRQVLYYATHANTGDNGAYLPTVTLTDNKLYLTPRVGMNVDTGTDMPSVRFTYYIKVPDPRAVNADGLVTHLYPTFEGVTVTTDTSDIVKDTVGQAGNIKHLDGSPSAGEGFDLTPSGQFNTCTLVKPHGVKVTKAPKWKPGETLVDTHGNSLERFAFEVTVENKGKVPYTTQEPLTVRDYITPFDTRNVEVDLEKFRQLNAGWTISDHRQEYDGPPNAQGVSTTTESGHFIMLKGPLAVGATQKLTIPLKRKTGANNFIIPRSAEDGAVLNYASNTAYHTPSDVERVLIPGTCPAGQDSISQTRSATPQIKVVPNGASSSVNETDDIAMRCAQSSQKIAGFKISKQAVNESRPGHNLRLNEEGRFVVTLSNPTDVPIGDELGSDIPEEARFYAHFDDQLVDILDDATLEMENGKPIVRLVTRTQTGQFQDHPLPANAVVNFNPTTKVLSVSGLSIPAAANGVDGQVSISYFITYKRTADIDPTYVAPTNLNKCSEDLDDNPDTMVNKVSLSADMPSIAGEPRCSSVDLLAQRPSVAKKISVVLDPTGTEKTSGITAGDTVRYSVEIRNSGITAFDVDAVDDLTQVLALGDLDSNYGINLGTTAGGKDTPDWVSVSRPAAAVSDKKITVSSSGTDDAHKLQPGQTLYLTYQVTIKPDSNTRPNDAANHVTPTQDNKGNTLDMSDKACEPKGDDQGEFFDPMPITEGNKLKTVCVTTRVGKVLASKSIVGDRPAKTGDSVTYKLEFENKGSAQTAISYTDVMKDLLDDAAFPNGTPDVQVSVDEGAPVQKAVVTQWDAAASELDISGTLEVGGKVSLTYTLNVLPEASRSSGVATDDTMVNYVVKKGEEVPTSCDETTKMCTSSPLSHLTLTKEAFNGDTQLNEGDTASEVTPTTYRVTVTNSGPGGAHFDVTDVMDGVVDDADMTAAPAWATGTTWADSEGTITKVSGKEHYRFEGDLPAATGQNSPKAIVEYQVTPKEIHRLPQKRGDNVLINKALPTPLLGTPDANVCEGDVACTSNPLMQVKAEKTVSVDRKEALPGTKLSYSIKLYNMGSVAGPIDYVDYVGGLDDVATISQVSCSDGCSADYDSSAHTITIHKDSQAPHSGDSATPVTVTYTATVKAGNPANSVAANYVVPASDDSAPAEMASKTCGDPDDFMRPCTRTPLSSLKVTKKETPRLLVSEPGMIIDYTVTFDNRDGGQVAKLDEFKDDVSDVLDDTSWVGNLAAWEGTPQTWNNNTPQQKATTLTPEYSARDKRITMGENPTVPAGEAVTVTYSVKVKSCANRIGGNNNAQNFVLYGNEQAPRTCDEDTGLCTSTLLPRFNVALVADKETAEIGDTVNYTMTITNIGAAIGTYEAISELDGVLDDAEGKALASGPTIDVTGNTVTYEADKTRVHAKGQLPVGGVATVKYSVVIGDVPGADGSLINMSGIKVDMESTDPNTRRLAEKKVITTYQRSDRVEINKSYTTNAATGQSVDTGNTVTYKVTIKNVDDHDVNLFGYGDDMSGVLDDATFASSVVIKVGDDVKDDWYRNNDGKLSFTNDAIIKPGETVTLTYTVKVKPDRQRAGGDAYLKNYVFQPHKPAPTTCADDDHTCSSIPLPRFDVSISRQLPMVEGDDPGTQVEKDVAEIGDKVRYTVKVTNTGHVRGNFAARIDLRDLLDDGEVVGNTPPVITGAGVGDGQTVAFTDEDGKRSGITAEGSLGADSGSNVATIVFDALIAPTADDHNHELNASVVLSDRERSATATVVRYGEVKVTKTSAVDGDLAAGKDVAYTLTFENIGKDKVKVNHEDHLRNVLDDATMKDPDALPATTTGQELDVEYLADEQKITVTGELPVVKPSDPAEKTKATLQYTVTVKDGVGDAAGAPEGSDGTLINIVVPAGESEDVIRQAVQSCHVPPADAGDDTTTDTSGTSNAGPTGRSGGDDVTDGDGSGDDAAENPFPCTFNKVSQQDDGDEPGGDEPTPTPTTPGGDEPTPTPTTPGGDEPTPTPTTPGGNEPTPTTPTTPDQPGQPGHTTSGGVAAHPAALSKTGSHAQNLLMMAVMMTTIGAGVVVIRSRIKLKK